jgi:hypothetical protein
VLILDMIEVFSPLGKYKYDTWRILPVKCYIDNSVRLWSCIRNVNTGYTIIPSDTKVVGNSSFIVLINKNKYEIEHKDTRICS